MRSDGEGNKGLGKGAGHLREIRSSSTSSHASSPGALIEEWKHALGIQNFFAQVSLSLTYTKKGVRVEGVRGDSWMRRAGGYGRVSPVCRVPRVPSHDASHVPVKCLSEKSSKSSSIAIRPETDTY
uniref:Uncharacterized protein n=1 Tax=Vespula pensylvanica TaxID=30213 RepID=A0A834MXY6_VESPE|nr:hypothetical protein H0235_017899 [Vespula pensylvanica]